jgi:hypothetical protein
MTENEFNTLNNHIGYGSDRPEIIIMGLEEGCDENSIRENYSYRFENINTNLIDLKAYHQQHPETTMNQWFAGNGKLQRTWANYCKLLIRYYALDMTPLEYQMNYLGNPNSKHALIEFYPLPRPRHSNYWEDFMNIEELGVVNISSYKKNHPNASRIKLINNLIISQNNLRALIIHGSIEKNNGNHRVRSKYSDLMNKLNITSGIRKHHLGYKRNGDEIISIEGDIEEKKVFFTPFFGCGAMTNIAIENLAALI